MGNQPSSPANCLQIDSPSTIALKEGDHYRYLAREEQRFKNECEEEARQAKQNGFGASAAEMTRQSQVHDKRMKLYNEEAAKLIYNANNNFLTSPQRILLHGLSIDEALTRVRERLFLLATSTTHPRLRDLTIVTGLPRLDASLLSIVQPTVQSLIQEHDLDVEYDQPDEGCVFVQLNWSAADDTGNVFDAIPVHAPAQHDDDEFADGDTVVDEDEFLHQGTPLGTRLRKEGYEGPGPSLQAQQEYSNAVRRNAGEESSISGWGTVAAVAAGAVALGFAIYKGTSEASSGKKRRG